ncbi:MAG: hypothetical protein JW870_15585 [Candidatus Delongbacteria bacterium]|nr:hypothetical protein [Candidatus Delongbacteria bacterium]
MENSNISDLLDIPREKVKNKLEKFCKKDPKWKATSKFSTLIMIFVDSYIFDWYRKDALTIGRFDSILSGKTIYEYLFDTLFWGVLYFVFDSKSDETFQKYYSFLEIFPDKNLFSELWASDVQNEKINSRRENF